ncbi:MAG TPA: hypothetical protein VMX35_04745 [Acidobacteriota bacterium]|nr:hypothetical protein [Acidobacteriota bacterium]
MENGLNDQRPADILRRRSELLADKLRVLQRREQEAAGLLRKASIKAERTGWILLGNLMILALSAVILLFGLTAWSLGWIALAILLVLLAATLLLLIFNAVGSREARNRLQNLQKEMVDTERALTMLRGVESAPAPKSPFGRDTPPV